MTAANFCLEAACLLTHTCCFTAWVATMLLNTQQLPSPASDNAAMW